MADDEKTAPPIDDDDDDLEVEARPAMAVEAMLDALAPSFLPGARAKLLQRFGPGAEHGGLAALVSFLADPAEAERHFDLDKPRPAGSPLRRLCRDLAGTLFYDGGADELHDAICMDPRLSPDALRREPGKCAKIVWDYMHTPEYRRLFRHHVRPPLPHREARVLAALDALEAEGAIPFGIDRELYATRWADLANQGHSFDHVVRGCATRLRLKGLADVPADAVVRASRAEPAPAPMTPIRAEWARMGGYEAM